MARLRFVPRAGLLVPYPGRGPGDNHHAGRSIGEIPVVDPKDPTAHLGVEIAHPLLDDGIDVLEGTKEAARFIELCRRDGDVHPFDEYTAKACGVPFVALQKRDDGEYEPAPAVKISAPQKASFEPRKAE